MSSENYSKLLISLSEQEVKNNVRLEAGTIRYNLEAQTAKFKLINHYNWTFMDGGLLP